MNGQDDRNGGDNNRGGYDRGGPPSYNDRGQGRWDDARGAYTRDDRRDGDRQDRGGFGGR